ncbi:MAG TPA: hypothetical protein VMB50_05120 [Myxococcales bacterium]|nr:hypothetical protein [Myxococcales bacterium]
MLAPSPEDPLKPFALAAAVALAASGCDCYPETSPGSCTTPSSADAGVTPLAAFPCDSCYALRVWPSGGDAAGGVCLDEDGNAYADVGPGAADWFSSPGDGGVGDAGTPCDEVSCGSYKDFAVPAGASLKIIGYAGDGGCTSDFPFFVQEFSGCQWQPTYADLSEAEEPQIAYYVAATPLVRVLSFGEALHVAVCLAPDASCAQSSTPSASQ